MFCPYCLGRFGRVSATCEDCRGSGVVLDDARQVPLPQTCQRCRKEYLVNCDCGSTVTTTGFHVSKRLGKDGISIPVQKREEAVHEPAP